MHSPDLVEKARALAARGANHCEIGRDLGIPRTTIRDWVNGRTPRRHPRRQGGRARTPLDRDSILHSGNASAYCYLLGLYLGDGHLTVHGSSARLRISLDSRYAEIIRCASGAIGAVAPFSAVRGHPIRGANLVVVACYSPVWPILFPQHGPGPKHARDVSLVDWQRALTAEHAEDFVRGLIHSDGCRFIARQRSKNRLYEYPRYAFCNRSIDLLREFCDHLDVLGIHWTRSNWETVQVARKEAVARMDEFIGPKR